MKLPSPIATGNTADIYLHDGKIVKVYTHASMKTAKREAANQKCAKSLGLQVPGVIEVRVVDGKPALVMERASGVSMKDLMLQQPDQLQEYLARTVEMQRRINSLPAPDLQLMSDRLRDQIGSVDEPVAIKKLELFAMLESLDDETQLCHGDFHVQNLIVDGDDITIIDWPDATRGNPVLDVCRSYILYTEFDTGFAEAYLEDYCRQSHMEPEEVLIWMPVMQAARMSEKMR